MNNIFFVYRLPYVVINFANIVVLSFVLHKHMHNNRPVMEVDLITFMSAAWVVRGNCLWKLVHRICGMKCVRVLVCVCTVVKGLMVIPLLITGRHHSHPFPLSGLCAEQGVQGRRRYLGDKSNCAWKREREREIIKVIRERWVDYQ